MRQKQAKSKIVAAIFFSILILQMDLRCECHIHRHDMNDDKFRYMEEKKCVSRIVHVRQDGQMRRSSIIVHHGWIVYVRKEVNKHENV